MLRLIADTRPTPILDERGDLLRMLEALFTSPAVRLSEVTTRSKGAYALVYLGTLPFYARVRRAAAPDDESPIAAGGGYPVYVGSSIQGLAERAGRHLSNIRDLEDISEADLRIILLPAGTSGGAVHLERSLIDELQPVWNQSFVSGFGSRSQGRARERGQRVARWNVLHPGRHVSPSAPRATASRSDLQAAVESYLNGVPNEFTHSVHGRLEPDTGRLGGVGYQSLA